MHKPCTSAQTWKAGAECVDGSGSLGVPNLLIALLECVCLEALPGEGASQEVEEHVAQGLQVIPPALLCSAQTGRHTVRHTQKHTVRQRERSGEGPPQEVEEHVTEGL